MGEFYSKGAFSGSVCSWRDFVLDEINYINSENGTADRGYWEDLDRNYKGNAEFNDVDYDNDLEPKREFSMELNVLNEIARKNRMSVFNLVLFIYNSALMKIFNTDELAVGYTMTNRFSRDKRNMVGMTTHHMKHYLKLTAEKSISELLKESRNQVSQSFKHYILGECTGETEFTLSYLSQVVLFPEWEGVETEIHTMNGNQKYASYDYTLMCREEGDLLRMSMCADTDVYDLRFTALLEKHMKDVLENLRSQNYE